MDEPAPDPIHIDPENEKLQKHNKDAAEELDRQAAANPTLAKYLADPDMFNRTTPVPFQPARVALSDDEYDNDDDEREDGQQQEEDDEVEESSAARRKRRETRKSKAQEPEMYGTDSGEEED